MRVRVVGIVTCFSSGGPADQTHGIDRRRDRLVTGSPVIPSTTEDDACADFNHSRRVAFDQTATNRLLSTTPRSLAHSGVCRDAPRPSAPRLHATPTPRWTMPQAPRDTFPGLVHPPYEEAERARDARIAAKPLHHSSYASHSDGFFRQLCRCHEYRGSWIPPGSGGSRRRGGCSLRCRSGAVHMRWMAMAARGRQGAEESRESSCHSAAMTVTRDMRQCPQGSLGGGVGG